MRWSEYLSAKTVPLCFLAIAMLLLTVFMLAVSVDGQLIAMAMGFFALLVAAWVLLSFWVERRRLRSLEQLVEELPEKYLLGEVLPRPRSVLEKEYFYIMQILSRSAIAVTEQARRDKDEYCDYVESWIHELKTPLTACSLILANNGDVRKLKRELKRADNLTENILYYARLRSVEHDTQIGKLQVAAVMDAAVKSQMELLIAAGISVEVDGDFAVHTDGKSLEFMLKQLLINCAKYCPGCRIRMHAAQGVLTVEDDGCGIPPHELRRVTERGFSGSNGRRLGGSTGMGLYIVSELCRQLDIGLDIQSDLGKYTRICFSFPTLTKV